MRHVILAAAFAALSSTTLACQAGSAGRTTTAEAKARDSAFAAMQARGKMAMGVDQYTSVHHFDALSDGGRIELVRETDDPAGVAQIRAHIRVIAQAFKTGDFSTPAFVHMQAVPGTAVMAARRAFITYEAHDVPRGAELRISTSDREALEAIHEFMAFQRSDHHAGGKMDTSAMRSSQPR